MSVGEVAVAELLRVEDHAEVRHELELIDAALRLGLALQLLGLLFRACDHVGEDLVQVRVQLAEAGCGRVGEDEGAHVLRMSGGVCGGEQSAIGVAGKVDLVGMKRSSYRIEVRDLRLHGLRCAGLDGLRCAGAALVVEEHEPILCDAACPDIVL